MRFKSPEGGSVVALDDAALHVAAGESVGLRGPSGSGKTTLALAILGLLSPTSASISGSVQFAGQELLRLPETGLRQIRGAKISLVFQEPGLALHPLRRVGDQVAEPIYAHRPVTWKQARRLASASISRFFPDSPDRISRSYPHQLSGGQMQRIAIAQAVSCHPRLLIAMSRPLPSTRSRSSKFCRSCWNCSAPQAWPCCSSVIELPCYRTRLDVC